MHSLVMITQVLPSFSLENDPVSGTSTKGQVIIHPSKKNDGTFPTFTRLK